MVSTGSFFPKWEPRFSLVITVTKNASQDYIGEVINQKRHYIAAEEASYKTL